MERFERPRLVNVDKATFEQFIKDYPEILTVETQPAFIPTQIAYVDYILDQPDFKTIIAITYDYNSYEEETGEKIEEKKKIYQIIEDIDDIYIKLAEYYEDLENERNPKNLED